MDGRWSRRRRRSVGVRGCLSLSTVGAGSDAEAIAESGSQATVCFSFGRRFPLACFADVSERGETLLDGGIAHSSGVEGAVEVVGETTVSMAVGFFRCLVWSAFCGLTGLVDVLFLWILGLGWVQVDAAVIG